MQAAVLHRPRLLRRARAGRASRRRLSALPPAGDGAVHGRGRARCRARGALRVAEAIARCGTAGSKCSAPRRRRSRACADSFRWHLLLKGTHAGRLREAAARGARRGRAARNSQRVSASRWTWIRSRCCERRVWHPRLAHGARIGSRHGPQRPARSEAAGVAHSLDCAEVADLDSLGFRAPDTPGTEAGIPPASEGMHIMAHSTTPARERGAHAGRTR